jgi:hypothetical protein
MLLSIEGLGNNRTDRHGDHGTPRDDTSAVIARLRLGNDIMLYEKMPARQKKIPSA